MFDFDALAEKTNKRDSLKLFRATLIDNIWYAVKANNKYIIEIDDNLCNKFEYLYSSNTNNYYPNYTIKKYDINPNRKHYGFWTILRPQLVIKGFIKNNKFILDESYLSKTLANEYKNSISYKRKS